MTLLNEHRLRYVNRAVGIFVIGALTISLVAAFQSRRVARWLNPLQPVKIVLPQEGLYGLSAGSSVEILGTTAGEVQAIVIDPHQQIHADVLIRRDMTPFVRQDSAVFIRKRFGVAGDSFLEITRGFGEPLDWEYAVLRADPDRAPTDLLQSTLQELRAEAVPLLQETHRAIAAYADLGEQMADPDGRLQTTLASLEQVAKQLTDTDGLVGRLLSDKAFTDDLQTTIRRVNADLARLGPVFDELAKTTANTTKLTAQIVEQSEDLPQITQRLTDNLDQLQGVLKDLRKTTPRLPEVTDSVADATSGIPALVIQTQSTLLEVEKLAESLRSSWLLGGGDDTPAAHGALTVEEAMP